MSRVSFDEKGGVRLLHPDQVESTNNFKNLTFEAKESKI